MSEPIPIDEIIDDVDRPIIDSDRTIGDTVELVPGNAPGERGRVRGIIRTRGRDERAQLLTVTIVGSGVFESSLLSSSTAPRGPLVALVEWGIRGGRAKAELDIPQGGIVFSLVASYVQIAARYDGLLLVNDVQLDPAATGLPNPGPKQRVGAMVGYGAYGPASRLTRTFRVDDVPKPGPLVPFAPDPAPAPPIPLIETHLSDRIPIPSFARRFRIMGVGLETISYRLRIGAFGPGVTNDVLIPVGSAPPDIALPGDAGFVEIENLGPDDLVNPTFVFDVGL